MKKTAAFAAMLAAATGAYGAINSHSYVQNGLVAQYDGIDNAGFGTHDPSANKWVNLKGDEDLDGTVASGVSWSTNGWSVSANCKPVTVGNKLSQTTGTGTFTIQFACKPETGANSGRQCFFSQYDASNSFGIEHNGTSVLNSLRLYCAKLGTSVASDADAMIVGRWASVSVTSSSTMKDIGFFTNGVSCGARSFASTPVVNADCPSVIGGEPYNNSRDMAFRGTYNAFRLYDRVLTEDEIKINAAVDAVRFNGASWSDFPELSTCSFDDEGYLMQLKDVAVEQDPVSRQTKITYKIYGKPAYVTVDVLTNSVENSASIGLGNVTHLSGDVNKFVDRVGETCTIWWQADKSWPGHETSQLYVRVYGRTHHKDLYCATNDKNGDSFYYDDESQIPAGIAAVSTVEDPEDPDAAESSVAGNATPIALDTRIGDRLAFASLDVLDTLIRDVEESEGRNLVTVSNGLMTIFN